MNQHEAERRTNDDLSLVRREEELRVGVERVRTGRVVVRKRVVEEEQTLTVVVRREEIEVIELGPDDVLPAGGGDEVFDVDRSETDRAVAVAERPAEPTGELVLFAERPVVTLERVPVEVVRLRTRAVQFAREVTAEVAREVVETEH